jgi:hypothetical protein
VTENPERLTIAQWGERTGIVVLDPDGFDRTDMELTSRLFTEDEFRRGVWNSTVFLKTHKDAKW